MERDNANENALFDPGSLLHHIAESPCSDCAFSRVNVEFVSLPDVAVQYIFSCCPEKPSLSSHLRRKEAKDNGGVDKGTR